MKRIGINMLFVVIAGFFSANASTLSSFLRNGKIWVIQVGYPIDLYSPNNIYCELLGDTLINDKQYLKYFIEDKYEGCFREEDRKVYYIGHDESEEKELYDFSLKEGDVFQGAYTLKEEYTIRGRRDTYRVMEFGCSWGWAINNYWIEGVGSLHDYPHHPFYMDKDDKCILTVVGVYIDYRTMNPMPTGNFELYTYPNSLVDEYYNYCFSNWANIISPFQKNDTPIYDLSGRQLQKKPTKGIYIQGGKKRIAKNE